MTLQRLGILYSELGDDPLALETLRTALDIQRRSLGEENPLYGISVVAIAEILRLRGQPRQALEQAGRALDVIVAKMGGDHHWTGSPRLVIGAALADLRRYRDAIPVLERSIAILMKGDPDRARAAFHLARALAATGKRAQAAELAAQARQELSETGRKRDIAVLDAWATRTLPHRGVERRNRAATRSAHKILSTPRQE